MNLPALVAATFAGSPPWSTVVIGLLGAGGIGAILLAVVKGKLYKRNTDSNANLTDAKTESIAVSSLEKVVNRLEKRADECEKDRAKMHVEMEAMRDRLTVLENTLAIYECRLKQAGLKTTMEGT